MIYDGDDSGQWEEQLTLCLIKSIVHFCVVVLQAMDERFCKYLYCGTEEV